MNFCLANEEHRSGGNVTFGMSSMYVCIFTMSQFIEIAEMAPTMCRIFQLVIKWQLCHDLNSRVNDFSSLQLHFSMSNGKI